MKATEINEVVIQKTHCDYIVEQAKELKELFSYNSKSMIKANKTRALTDIEEIRNSLQKLEFYIKEL